MYQKPIRDMDQLQQCLTEVWSYVQQTVVDVAIGEWRKRLGACAHAKRHHFEHLLYFFYAVSVSVRPIHLNIIL